MKKKLLLILFCSLVTTAAIANEGGLPPKQMKWPFTGMTGKFDRQAIQRGFQVYKEVCSACHSVHLVAYRDLKEVGFSDAEIKTIAAEYKVPDTDDSGEPIERNALPSDHFVPPYPNEKASRAANNGALPPDLSLMLKARHDGANYVYSLLTGFNEPVPTDIHVPDGQHYNPYFATKLIAMSPPLVPNIVKYMDGTEATIDQMARDVVHFLEWTAEPELEKRKRKN